MQLTQVVGVLIYRAPLQMVTMTDIRSDSYPDQANVRDRDDTALAEARAEFMAELAAFIPLPDAHFRVGGTADGRGQGLFVADEPIAASTFLFDYKGVVLDQAGWDERYEGRELPDYCVEVIVPGAPSVWPPHRRRSR